MMELAGLTECEDRRVFNLPELIFRNPASIAECCRSRPRENIGATSAQSLAA
jgi:hypothetical protein